VLPKIYNYNWKTDDLHPLQFGPRPDLTGLWVLIGCAVGRTLPTCCAHRGQQMLLISPVSTTL